MDEPRIVERAAQPYAAIAARVTMESLGNEVPGLHPEVRRWLDDRKVAIEGGPFVKYNVIDMDRELEVEAGFPVAAAVAATGRVSTGLLPGGRYAVMTHNGAPDGLLGATDQLLRWAESEGLQWDLSDDPHGQRWAARLEIYELDPPPDMADWKTELAFRLADV